MDGTQVVLVAAIVAPLAGFVPLLVLAGDGERWARRGALVATVLWATLLLSGDRPELGALHPDQLALAAGAGTALLAAACSSAGRAPWAGAAGTAMSVGLVMTKGVALDPGALVLGVMAAALVVAAGSGARPAETVAVAVAGAMLAAGVHAGTGSAGIGLFAVGAAALVVVAGSATGPLVVVLAVALGAGLRWLPVLEKPDRLAWVGVVLACAAATTAVAPLVHRRLRAVPAAVPIGLWSLAAATGVAGTRTAAGLLAAAAVLTCVLALRAAAMTALPGAALVGAALIDASGGRAAVVAVAGVVTLAAVVAAAAGDASPDAPPIAEVAVPAALIGLWLVALPSAWRWARPGDLEAYEQGVAIAAATGAAAFVVAVATGGRSPVLPQPSAAVAALEVPPHRTRMTVLAVVGALAIVAFALVRSSGLMAALVAT